MDRPPDHRGPSAGPYGWTVTVYWSVKPWKDFEKVYRIRIEAEYQKYFTEGKTGHLWNGDHEILNQFLEIRYSNGKIRNVPTQLHQNNRNAPPKRLYGTVNSPSDILTQAGISG